ncbi:MAG: transglycosylase SLT domain-containing protein [Candidatus Gastranaerophilales bacterium]|nr:transglycosylase SLT domain-containing protein [Candidatus Gastranaerophilales bacterium]
MSDKLVTGVSNASYVPSTVPEGGQTEPEEELYFETPSNAPEVSSLTDDDIAPIVQSEFDQYKATSIDEITAIYANYDTKIDLDIEAGQKYDDSSMDFDDTTLTGLETRREQISGNLKTSEKELSDVYSGSHEKLKELSDNLSSAQEGYDNAVNESKNPAIQAMADEINYISQNIGEQEKVVSFIDTQIAQTENQILTQNSAITALDSEISSYDAQIANFQQALSSLTDENQKAQLSALIQNLQKAKGNAQARKTNEESVLATLEQKKEALSEQKPQEEDKLNTLTTRQGELEDSIKNINDETVTGALDTLNQMREQYKELQNELITQINSDIESYNTQLNEVDELITTLKEQIFSEEAKAVTDQLQKGEEVPNEIESTAYPSGGGGSVGSAGSGGYSGSSPSSKKASDTVSIDVLKNNFEDADKKVKQNRKSRQDIFKGKNEDLSAIKRVSDENYTKLSSKLTELNPELAASLDSIKTELDSKEAEIDAIDLKLAEYEDELSSMKISLTGVDINISALNEAKTGLDKVDKSKLDSENLKKYNEKKEALDKELKELSDKKTNLQNSIKDKESGDDYKEYKELKQQRTALKQEYDEKFAEFQNKLSSVEAQYPELKELSTAYLDSKNKYDSNKKEAIEEANNEIAQNQAAADELYKTYETANAKQNASQYAFSDGSIPSDLAGKLDAKLGAGFSAKVEEISREINCDPKDLLGMMMSESGLNPQAVNGSSGATGLIQFMPSTAKGLGTTTSALKQMSAIEQLDYVKAYFGSHQQKMEAGDLYTQCFLPARVGQNVVCNNSDILAWAYKANPGFDSNKDGSITRDEMSAFVQRGYNRLLSSYGLA